MSESNKVTQRWEKIKGDKLPFTLTIIPPKCDQPKNFPVDSDEYGGPIRHDNYEYYFDSYSKNLKELTSQYWTWHRIRIGKVNTPTEEI